MGALPRDRTGPSLLEHVQLRPRPSTNIVKSHGYKGIPAIRTTYPIPMFGLLKFNTEGNRVKPVKFDLPQV